MKNMNNITSYCFILGQCVLFIPPENTMPGFLILPGAQRRNINLEWLHIEDTEH